MVSALLAGKRALSPIGLDIGASGVRTAQVARAGNRWVVTQMAAATHQPVDDGDQQEGDAAADTLKRCMIQAHFAGRQAVAGLSTPDVEFHTLELPDAMARDRSVQAEQVVHHEVSRLMTYEEGTVETRHWVLPPTTVPAPNALGLAAPRDRVHHLLGLCRSAGISCTSVDSEAAGLCRFGLVLKGWTEEEIWGVLDLGARQARLTICLAGVPILVRAVGDGGDRWTELLADSLQISRQAADVHKHDHGIALAGRGLRHDDRNAPATELASIILGVLRVELNKLAVEVKRSYEYALSCYPRSKVAELILVGGGASMHNIAEYLGSALGIRVCQATGFLEDPDCRLQCSTGRRNPLERYAVAIGLAMGALPFDD